MFGFFLQRIFSFFRIALEMLTYLLFGVPRSTINLSLFHIAQLKMQLAFLCSYRTVTQTKRTVKETTEFYINSRVMIICFEKWNENKMRV